MEDHHDFLNEVRISIITLVWKIYSNQGLCININWVTFWRMASNLLVRTSGDFLVQYIIWWSESPTSMTLCCETLLGKLASMWSMMVELLQVTRVGTSINCLIPDIVQNSCYLLVSLGIVWPWSKLFFWKMYELLR